MNIRTNLELLAALGKEFKTYCKTVEDRHVPFDEWISITYKGTLVRTRTKNNNLIMSRIEFYSLKHRTFFLLKYSGCDLDDQGHVQLTSII